eukprot:1804507-Lingulodinium_polyedra.AAC.1
MFDACSAGSARACFRRGTRNRPRRSFTEPMGGGVWQHRHLLDADGERVLRATPMLEQHVFLPVPCRGGPF